METRPKSAAPTYIRRVVRRARPDFDQDLTETHNTGPDGGVYLQFPGGMRLLVAAAEWAELNSSTSNIPCSVLMHLKKQFGEAPMRLRLSSLAYLPGKQFIINQISKQGAIFLLTNKGQSDLAFPVTGCDLVSFGKYVMEGLEVQHTQYVGQMPDGFLDNMLYNETLNALPHRIGSYVRYEDERKDPQYLSHQVIFFCVLFV
jgi:hypothetical protein